VDNQPAKAGYLTYIPVDGMSSTSGGQIVDGKYTATVPIGKMKVQIHVPKVIGEKRTYEADPNSPMQPISVESLPPKYNVQTELVLDVKPGENKKDYDLSTTAK
jgi:hypothetical protein